MVLDSGETSKAFIEANQHWQEMVKDVRKGQQEMECLKEISTHLIQDSTREPDSEPTPKPDIPTPDPNPDLNII